MSIFWNLYHQILQSIIGNSSSVLGLLPVINLEHTKYYFPEEIFPAGLHIDRISGDITALDAVESLDLGIFSPIFVMPPYGVRKDWPNELKEKFRAYHSIEAIVLRNVVRRMKSGSVIVALMPNSFLMTQSDRLARKEIFSIVPPVTLISHQLPWSELEIPFFSGFQVSTIVMVKSENPHQMVRFFGLEQPKDVDQADEILSDFKRLQKQAGGQTSYGYVVRDRNQIGDQWNFDYHHPETIRRKQELKVFGNTRLISDIFEIFRGGIHRVKDSNILIDNRTIDTVQGIPLIEGRDLRSDGSITLETRYCVVDPPPEALLKRGDILIRAVHSFSSIESLPVIEVTDDQPLTASESSLGTSSLNAFGGCRKSLCSCLSPVRYLPKLLNNGKCKHSNFTKSSW